MARDLWTHDEMILVLNLYFDFCYVFDYHG